MVAEVAEDFAEALDLDMPIVASPEVPAGVGLPEDPIIGSAEREHACQNEKDRCTIVGPHTER